VVLPGGMDANELLKRSVAELKVGFVPGSPFFINPDNGTSCIRLNFSSNTPDKIADGMERLGNLIGNMMGSALKRP
jgi:2-aminoadipate transaminase